MRKAVVVLGMHRSGTSTITGMLYHSGLSIGKSEMGSNATNPKGFFENYRLMAFNDALLAVLNCTWNSTVGLPSGAWETAKTGQFAEELTAILTEEFPGSAPILVKDPRLCLLLPVYLAAFREIGIEPSFVMCTRNPSEVAKSLSARDHFASERSLFLWTYYTLSAELHSRGYTRIFIDYADILRDPLNVLRVTRSALLPLTGLSAETEQIILEFVDPALNHGPGASTDGPQGKTGEMPNLYETLCKLRFRNTNQDEELALSRIAERFFADHNPGRIPRIRVRILLTDGLEGLESTLKSVYSHPYLNLHCELVIHGIQAGLKEWMERYGYLGLKSVDSGKMAAEDKTGLQLTHRDEERTIFLKPGELLSNILQ